MVFVIVAVEVRVVVLEDWATASRGRRTSEVSVGKCIVSNSAVELGRCCRVPRLGFEMLVTMRGR